MNKKNMICCVTLLLVMEPNVSGMSFLKLCTQKLGGVFAVVASKMPSVLSSKSTFNSAVSTVSHGLGVCAYGADRAIKATPSLPLIRSIFPWIKNHKFASCCVAVVGVAVAIQIYMAIHGDNDLINAVRSKHYTRAYFLMYCGAEIPETIKDELSNDLEQALATDDRDYGALLVECGVMLEEEQLQKFSEALLNAFVSNDLERAKFLIECGVTISDDHISNLSEELPDEIKHLARGSKSCGGMNAARKMLVDSLHYIDGMQVRPARRVVHNVQRATLLTRANVRLDSDGIRQMGRSLHDAALRGDRFFLRMLLESGMPTNGNNFPETALHCAMINGYRGIMDDLLKRGANPNARDKDGLTPLDYADRLNQVRAGAFLVRHRETDLSTVEMITNNNLRDFALGIREERVRRAEVDEAE